MRRTCLLYVVGNNFGLATVAPVIEEMRRQMPRTRQVVAVVGDDVASESELRQLGLDEADYRLGFASTSQVTATTTAMEKIERVAAVEQPGFFVVAGNSAPSLAAALTALGLGIRCAHLDAGLRSSDRGVSAEVNGVIVDSFADLLFVSCERGIANLRSEGIDGQRVHLVGSTVVDALDQLAPHLRHSTATDRLGLGGRPYLLVALRDASFAAGSRLAAILDRLVELSATMRVVMPTPDSAREAVRRYVEGSDIRLTERLDYVSVLALQAGAAGVLTDRDSIQAETTHLGRPCFTLRGRTDRTTTLLQGTNRLLGEDPAAIAKIPPALRKPAPEAEAPPLWDGRASQRVAETLSQELSARPTERAEAPQVGVL
jgi:UDP-N-acetylglucosamine 2-epimerase (non-hydrolysing)